MVQKIQPRGVIWGAFFPPPVETFFRKNQSSVLSIYIVILALGTLSVPDEDVVSAGELETLPLSTFTVPKPRPTRPVEPDSPKMGSMSSSVQMMTSFSPQVQANDPLLSGRSPMGKVRIFTVYT